MQVDLIIHLTVNAKMDIMNKIKSVFLVRLINLYRQVVNNAEPVMLIVSLVLELVQLAQNAMILSFLLVPSVCALTYLYFRFQLLGISYAVPKWRSL